MFRSVSSLSMCSPEPIENSDLEDKLKELEAVIEKQKRTIDQQKFVIDDQKHVIDILENKTSDNLEDID